MPLYINFKDKLSSYGEKNIDFLSDKLVQCAETSIVVGLYESEFSNNFLRNFDKLQAILRTRLGERINVTYELRTTGAGLTNEQASFLKENNITVCLLMDGPKDIHERNANLLKRMSFHEQTVQAANLLTRYKVNLYIGITVTSVTAVNIQSIFSFLVGNGWTSWAFWPAICEGRSKSGSGLLPLKDYQYFVQQLFLLWKDKRIKGQPLYIREFENFAGCVKGYAPLVSSMCGQCPFQNIFFPDGKFYIRGCQAGRQEYLCVRLEEQKVQRVEDINVKSECKTCRWASLCQGDRTCCMNSGVFCEIYKEFYPYALPGMLELLRHLGR